MSLLDYSDTSIAGVIIIGGMSFAFLSVLSLCSLLVWCRWWGEEGRLAGTRRRSNNSLVIVRIGMDGWMDGMRMKKVLDGWRLRY